MLFKRARAGGHAVRVTSEAEIKWFIDNHEVQNGQARATDGSHYYWLTTERPNAEAVDRLLNRVFGKPVEQQSFTGEGEDGTPHKIIFEVVDPPGRAHLLELPQSSAESVVKRALR